MNIENLQEHIALFKREVIDSGFKRDLDDFVSSLPNAQSNIIQLREIANKTLAALTRIYSRDLPEALRILLPSEKIPPFTVAPHNEKLKELVANTELQQPAFHSSLSQFLSQLQQQVNQNIAEVKRIEQFIAPYAAQDLQHLATAESAIVGIVFKDKTTITSLNEFSKTLKHWSRTLPLYHQLIKSKVAPDIGIVAVQNGSIDFAVNINVDVAVNLAEVFAVGFHAFATYLGYKKMVKPLMDSYYGNKKLIEMENEREKHLLENVRDAVQRQIELQHNDAKSSDKKVDGAGVQIKIKEVANLIVSHIVKGNDLKLVALPPAEATDSPDTETPMADAAKKKDALLESSITARRELNDMRPEDKQKLLELYGDPESGKKD